MPFWTYILRCSDGIYYTGHTEDIDKRIAEHVSGALTGFTHAKRPLEFMWADEFPSRAEALEAELKIKKWSRAKKEALIAADWKKLRRFAIPPSEREERVSASLDHMSRLRSTGAAKGKELLNEVRSRDTQPSEAEAPPPIIVLVRPQLGENIGKAARAMLNFGLADLRLVNPRDGWPNPAAGPAASGADVVLARAQVFDSVAAAVADCAHVYATTVRKRELVLPVITPEQAAREVRAAGERSAILFGAERAGLETDEAALAGKIVTVPINPAFRSLNLAQAVILFAYEWSKHEALAVPTEAAEEPRAPHAELEGLIGQLDAALDEAGYFFPPERSQASRRTIRTIMAKAGWSSREVRAVRGMIRALVSPRRR